MGYTSTLILLTQTPAGASAVHSTGKLFRRGHQRFYETQDRLLDWMWYGSASEQAVEGIERVNKIHAGVWKNAPGTFSHPWEGQMSLIGSAYFETYLRDLVGARVRDIHPKLAAAWPAWAERACAHFRSEPEDGSRSFGVNFPRDWKELEAFHKWYRELPFDKYTSEEERAKGAVISKGVVDQFAELWFPRYISLNTSNNVNGISHKRAGISNGSADSCSSPSCHPRSENNSAPGTLTLWWPGLSNCSSRYNSTWLTSCRIPRGPS